MVCNQLNMRRAHNTARHQAWVDNAGATLDDNVDEASSQDCFSQSFWFCVFFMIINEINCNNIIVQYEHSSVIIKT